MLHAGLPKTGTSALQRWFHLNRAMLASVGVCYPDGSWLENYRHQFLVSALRSGEFQVLDQFLAQAGSGTVLLSAEGLTNHLDDFQPAALAAFRSRVASHRVELLVVTREPNSWFESYYRQCVINPPNGASQLWGTALDRNQVRRHPRVKRLLAHTDLLSDAEAAFGAERLVAPRYEADWFEQVKSWVGLGSANSAPLPRANPSAPDWAVELVRRLNAMDIPAGRLAWWKRKIGETLEDPPQELMTSGSAARATPTELARDLDALESSMAGQEAEQSVRRLVVALRSDPGLG